jgi:hypothetical protein
MDEQRHKEKMAQTFDLGGRLKEAMEKARLKKGQ